MHGRTERGWITNPTGLSLVHVEVCRLQVPHLMRVRIMPCAYSSYHTLRSW